MRKPEQQLWDTLKRNRTIPGNVIRVENKACDGTPDLNSCYDGIEFWVELKVGKRTQLKRLFKISQPPWHLARVHHGGKVYILLKEPGNLPVYVLYKVIFAIDFEKRYSMLAYSNNLIAIRKALIISLLEA